MRTVLFALFAGVILASAAGCGSAVSAADDAASSCANCHRAQRSFTDQDPENVAGKIRAIRDGELRHPPLALDDDSDEAIDALAAELTDK